MNLSEMFRNKVVTVRPQESIAAAAMKMKSENVGTVVVVENERIVGIVTDRDIAMSVVGSGVSSAVPVSEIMTRQVVTIWDDQGVFNATQYVKGHKIRRLPIIDRQEKLVGMLTADDLFGLLAREVLNVAQSLEPAIGTRV